MSNYTIQLARTDEEILHCRDTILALREQLDPGRFLPMTRRMMEGGFNLAYLETEGVAACVAGFRFDEMYHRGVSMYIDDLVTLPAYRSRRYGGRMIDWLFVLAGQRGCRQVHLDSGVQRFDAHRFYLNKGFRISSHHFVCDLPGPFPGG